MTKTQYMELFGESPEEMFGPDWSNILEELSYNPDRPYELVSDLQNGVWPAGKKRVED